MADPHAAAGIGVGSGQDSKTADAKVHSPASQMEPSTNPLQVTLTDGQFIKPRVSSPFLELPREIRDEIYAYAMVPGVLPYEEALGNRLNDGQIHFKDCLWFECQRHVWYPRGNQNLAATEEIVRIQSVTPGLLLTSHKVYREALSILYGRNYFADDFSSPHGFFTLLGHSSQYVRNLRFDGFWVGCRSGKFLESLIHLQHLSVGLPYDGQSRKPSTAAELFFDKAYRWISGVASVKGEQARAIEYLHVDCPSKCNGKSVGHIKDCEWDASFKATLRRLIKARPPTSSIPFLKFPRKIRDMIYVYAMVYQPHVYTTTHVEHYLNISKHKKPVDQSLHSPQLTSITPRASPAIASTASNGVKV